MTRAQGATATFGPDRVMCNPSTVGGSPARGEGCEH